jgi:hypothetical protein
MLLNVLQFSSFLSGLDVAQNSLVMLGILTKWLVSRLSLSFRTNELPFGAACPDLNLHEPH